MAVGVVSGTGWGCFRGRGVAETPVTLFIPKDLRRMYSELEEVRASQEVAAGKKSANRHAGNVPPSDQDRNSLIKHQKYS